MVTKSLREWMKELGYTWAPGREGIYKGSMLLTEARDIITDLRMKGDIVRG